MIVGFRDALFCPTTHLPSAFHIWLCRPGGASLWLSPTSSKERSRNVPSVTKTFHSQAMCRHDKIIEREMVSNKRKTLKTYLGTSLPACCSSPFAASNASRHRVTQRHHLQPPVSPIERRLFPRWALKSRNSSVSCAVRWMSVDFFSGEWGIAGQD